MSLLSWFPVSFSAHC